MKFSVVEMGQRFSFNGESFTKSGPLVGNNEQTGEKKFFRRADNVQPIFESVSPVHDEQMNMCADIDTVMQSFERFYSSCIDALDENLSVELADEKNALFTAMEQAKEQFMADCKISV